MCAAASHTDANHTYITPSSYVDGAGGGRSGINYWEGVVYVILAGIDYACLHRVQIACTNAGPDKMRSCFYVLVSGTLLLSQGPLIVRTPK